jgi:hypothetical protein
VTASATTVHRTTISRRKARLVAIAGAALAGLVVFGVARLALGSLRQPAFGTAKPQDLNAAIVVVASLIGGLIGAAFLTLLERLTHRPRRLWALLAPLALLLSLAAPLSGHGVSGGNRLALVLMHLAVGGVLIPLLDRSSAVTRERS